MVHIALGSFLSLQAYYGSTFVDGTGAVVGVGLLRNLGGLMTGLTFAGIIAGRMIPELRILSQRLAIVDDPVTPSDVFGQDRARGVGEPLSAPRLAIAPSPPGCSRIAPAGIACLLLSQWGIAVGTWSAGKRRSR